MTTIFVLLLVGLVAAGVALLNGAIRSRRRTHHGGGVRPVSRRPARAELELAKPPREGTGEQVSGGESGRIAEPKLRGVPSAGGPRPMLGYASWDGRNGLHAGPFRGQAEQIASECNRLGVKLLGPRTTPGGVLGPRCARGTPSVLRPCQPPPVTTLGVAAYERDHSGRGWTISGQARKTSRTDPSGSVRFAVGGRVTADGLSPDSANRSTTSRSCSAGVAVRARR
jgi:hypothetical protein